MDRQSFLNALSQATMVWMRYWRCNETPPPFTQGRPLMQLRQGVVSLITPNDTWAEYSPEYDIEGFDGITMTFLAEDYVMEIRL